MVTPFTCASYHDDIAARLAFGVIDFVALRKALSAIGGGWISDSCPHRPCVRRCGGDAKRHAC